MLLSLFQISNDIIVVMLAVVAFIISVTAAIVLHEVAHGYAAYINGDATAKVNGRLSLNPVVHFDLMGFLMLALVGFGFAKPVPVNPYNFKNPKKGMLMVSLAGVVTNLILAIIFMFFFVLVYFLMMQITYDTSEFVNYILIFCSYLCQFMIMINLNLMLFNLLPFGPLDGLKVLEALCRRGNRVTEFLRTNGTYIIFGLFGLSIISSYFASEVPFFEYIDLLGMYLEFFRHNIAGGIIWLFSHIFGINPNIGFYYF